MAKIFRQLTDLIGNTPLLELTNYNSKHQLNATIIAKLEYFNPAGSIKDRVGLAMIEDAQQRGLLQPGGTIIEPTSGNTGVGLAMVATIKGYNLILTMPETMSVERRKLLAALGAKIVLTPGAKGMSGAIDEAIRINNSTPNSVILQQFENPSNPAIHRATTAQEIWKDTDGKVDIVVAGVGTGGTITGLGERLKTYNQDIRIVAVEPFGSPVLSGGKPGNHGLQGIGAGFIPKTLNTKVIDEIIVVKDYEAIDCSKEVAKTDGILVGITSGAALFASSILAQRIENKGKNIITIMPDTGERYISTPLFD